MMKFYLTEYQLVNRKTPRTGYFMIVFISSQEVFHEDYKNKKKKKKLFSTNGQSILFSLGLPFLLIYHILIVVLFVT
jgi:hypothetical protein